MAVTEPAEAVMVSTVRELCGEITEILEQYSMETRRLLSDLSLIQGSDPHLYLPLSSLLAALNTAKEME